MFGDRQEFDMGKAHFGAIGDQPFRQLVPAKEGAVSALLPGTSMDLIDRDRLAALVDAAPMSQMCRILPVLGKLGGGDRSGLRAKLAAAGERIGLQRQKLAIDADDLVFIGRTWPDIGGENLPDAGIAAQPHHMAAAIPFVEIADHRDPSCIRRPDGEMKAINALMLDRMGAHLVEQPQMRPFAQEVIVHGSENRAETIGIGQRPFHIAPAGAVAHWLLGLDRHRTGEKAGWVKTGQLSGKAAVERERGNAVGARHKTAGNEPIRSGMNAEHRKRIGVQAGDDGFDLGRRQVVSGGRMAALG